LDLDAHPGAALGIVVLDDGNRARVVDRYQALATSFGNCVVRALLHARNYGTNTGGAVLLTC
jgi:hypothetical protein